MSTEDLHSAFGQEDHQVAFIFNPEEEEPPRRERPPKRRKTARRSAVAEEEEDEDGLRSSSWFAPLLGESVTCVRRRERLLEENWAMVDARIQGILRDSNSATLDGVSQFVREAKSECGDKIPSAFIITGPNIASQDLLFEQLSESLQRASTSKFVRLRSSEATNLKNALKKIIQEATSQSLAVDGEEDLQLAQGSGRRYLPYDLEALRVFLEHQPQENIFVAFQDSEGFDSGLLSDIITLLSSWRPQIPFTLLFGIATSIDLLEGRLLKAACRLIYGAQFDCVQTETILESVFVGAVISSDIPLRLGPQILRGMLDRQRDQMAGIQAFISSLKYVYMCHFYANALSILMAPETAEEGILQAGHIEALRHLPSFRHEVETAVERATADSLEHARSLLEDDEYLLAQARASNERRQDWMDDHLRLLLVREAAGAVQPPFSRAYVDSLSAAYPESGNGSLTEHIRRMGSGALASMLRRVISIFKDGEPSLHLQPASKERDTTLLSFLEDTLSQLEKLESDAESAGMTLHSKYSSQSKVMRTTVIAQRVQLSRDSAALRDEDKQLTAMVDAVSERLTAHFGPPRRPDRELFSEAWLYDSRSPLRDVMVPRPRVTFRRSLARPYDYLSCDCCRGSGGGGDDAGAGAGVVRATFPAVSILYHLYLEAGSLINVADLWSAFYALVREEKEGDDGVVEGEGEEDGEEQRRRKDERRALVLFYRGLAELKALGFVKSSKKKADHVAKVRWL